MEPTRIPAKQRRTRFIKEFLKDRNATRAAIAAGYSERSARVAGARLIADANIRSQIETENDKINSKLEVSEERIRLELARLAYFDPVAIFNEDGSVKPISEIDEDTRRAICGVDVTELFEGLGDKRNQVGYAKKIKLTDKTKALEQLGRHLKMFTDKVEVSASDELIAKLMEGRKRAAARKSE